MGEAGSFLFSVESDKNDVADPEPNGCNLTIADIVYSVHYDGQGVGGIARQ